MLHLRCPHYSPANGAKRVDVNEIAIAESFWKEDPLFDLHQFSAVLLSI